MTYYSDINNIKTNIISGLMGITWISNCVYKNTWRTDTRFPNIYVYTRDDDTVLAGLSDNDYILRPGYGIVFRNLATGAPETDKQILESGVGAVFDKLRSMASLYSGTIVYEKLEIEDIDYAYESPGINPKTVVEAQINVRVEKHAT